MACTDIARRSRTRGRSVSAPALRVSCSSYSRERSRLTDLAYERGKDNLAHWISAWSFDEVCAVLRSLVARCPLNQLEYLWTALESIPHRDFLHGAGGSFLPFSTPRSREIRARLSQSKRPQNKHLYRVQSAVIRSEAQTVPLPNSRPETQLMWRCTAPLETTTPSRLPGLCPRHPTTSTPSRGHTRLIPSLRHNTHPSPSLLFSRPHTKQSLGRSLSTPPSRIPSPVRRHMLSFPSPSDLLTAMERGTHTPALLHWRAFSPQHLPPTEEQPSLPPEAVQFLPWFSDLDRDWQQQEILQLVVWNLDQRELYFLATLLMSRQYRDFISQLPETLACQVLSFVPPRDILRHCCRVSRSWSARCSSEPLWRTKCHQHRLGLPLRNFLSWKHLFIDDLRLKRNWRRGRCVTSTLQGHTHKVLCVRLKEDLAATGSADTTIRVWNLESGECLCSLKGHLKAVWCLCFYGKNLLISGSSDQSIKVWNVRTGTCERTLEGHNGTIWALQQKEEVLISGAHDKTAVIWDIRHCCLVRRLEGHQGAVFAVDLDNPARVAFTASGDKTIMQWTVESGHRLRVIKASRTHPIMAMHWHNGYLASSAEHVITLWTAHSGRKLLEFKGHEDRVESVQLKIYDHKKHSGLILSASRDRTVKYWDTRSGHCIQTLTGHEDRVNCAWSDEVRIASTSDDLLFRIWDFHPHRFAYSCKEQHILD